MIVKLLTEHHLELLSLNGGVTGSSESTHVKMQHCWKYHTGSYHLDTFSPLAYTGSTFSSGKDSFVLVIYGRIENNMYLSYVIWVSVFASVLLLQ